MIQKYKELPLYAGIDDQYNTKNLKLIVFVNKDSNTYTVALINEKNDTFCTVTTGAGKVVKEYN